MDTLLPLANGSPHERYIYGYLSTLRAQYPKWVVEVTTADTGERYIWLRAGPRGAPTAVIQIIPGLERTAISAVRAFADQFA